MQFSKNMHDWSEITETSFTKAVNKFAESDSGRLRSGDKLHYRDHEGAQVLTMIWKGK